MRNLKKILALALALVMTLSVMSVANAFTDDANINETYAEAVDVLAGLKVFRGYTDGSYQPKGEITRAEVAAIVYRIVTGDVDDTQVGIYADNNKFTDVASTSWYAGYVNFCANAEYILGYGDGTFGPNDKVTGYQALAMILRAIGYGKMGEFTGKDWDINTASRGEALGITKNITAGTLGVAATREVVAEILFRAILVPQVTYTLAFGYAEGDESLGYKTFKLEEIEGVVIANEFADLYDDEPLAAGKTQIETEDKTYTLSYASELTDIGESRYAYVSGSTVYALADTGDNTVYENKGAAADISSSSKFSKVTGLSDSAEHYINFADANENSYETDIRIVYSVDGVTYYSIKAGAKMTQAQYDAIKSIFEDDDLDGADDGYVVVGTKFDEATAAEDDISNEMTFKAFVKEYLTASTANTNDVTGAENGEWLKVVDNDGDGKADFVFLTKFTMTVIEDYDSRDDEYTFQGDGVDKVNDRDTAIVIDEADIVTEDELAEDDVVLYTLIDGVYYVSVVTPVVKTIDKKGIDYKNETITCGDDTYEWSGIEHAAYEYYHDVSEADVQVSYDLYLDHFGYVRLFSESVYSREFVLLTDGYFETDKRNEETYKAETWNVADEDYEDVVVLDDDSDYPADTFIDDATVNGDKDWDRLKEAGEVYFGKPADDKTFVTNLAAMFAGEDGVYLAEVQDVTNSSKISYYMNELQLTDDSEVSDKTLYSVQDDGDEYKIQATTDTLYYFVLRSGNTIKSITTWVGYNNAPSNVKLGANAVGYTVSSYTWRDAVRYDVAEVVVYESDAYVSETVNFAYALGQKLIGENFVDIEAIGYDSETETYGTVEREGKVNEDGNYPIDIDDLIEFYTIKSNKDVELIDKDYADFNIYAGFVTVAQRVSGRDYVQVNKGFAVDVNANPVAFDLSDDYVDFYAASVPGFAVTYSAKYAAETDYVWFNGTKVDRVGNVTKTYGVEENTDYSAGTVETMGDRVIYVTDSKDNVLYVINVDESLYTVDGNHVVVDALEELWLGIIFDQMPDDQTIKLVSDPAGVVTTVSNLEVPYGRKNVKVVLNVAEGYTIDDVDVSGAEFTYNVGTQTVTLAEVSGPVTITVKATVNTYNITDSTGTDYDADGLPTTAAYGSTVSFTVAATAAAGDTANGKVVKVDGEVVGTFGGGVTAKAAVYTEIPTINDTDSLRQWQEIKGTLYTEDAGVYTAVAADAVYADGTTYYFMSAEAVDAVAATATCSFTMPAKDVAVTVEDAPQN